MSQNASFSQRNHFASIPLPLVPGEMPEKLRLELEDVLVREYEEGIKNFLNDGKAANWDKVLGRIWVRIFGMSRTVGIKALCIEECSRRIKCHAPDKVLTLIEELAKLIGEKQPSFQKEVNEVLSYHQAPYILHCSSEKGWMMIQTGSEVDRDNILQCLSDLKDPAFEKTREHFEKAGRLLSKQEYAESVGQSIKAFEACLRKLANRPTLWGIYVLEECDKKFNLPLPLKESMKDMFKYRNDAEDVGHSKKEGSTCPVPDRWDAQLVYTLIASYIAYLVSKCRDKK